VVALCMIYSLMMIAPHSGQSSQLSLDHEHGSAQFLPAVARNALNLTVNPNREHWCLSA